MKRIVGRKMINNQIDTYSDLKVQPLDPLVVLNTPYNQLMIPFRFRWGCDLIDVLRKSGSVCYRLLDIGTYDGKFSLIASSKHTDETETVIVDAIEAHKQSFDAVNEMANSARQLGLKINVYNTLFENYETDTTYDMIVAFEMLEHTKDPLFCIEKIYEMLEIGGHLLITVPEESGTFGIRDKNPYHYWTSTMQSVVFSLFSDDRKWHIKQMIEVGDLIHIQVQKITKM